MRHLSPARLAAPALSLLLSACVAGPDYAGPPPAPAGSPARFVRATVPDTDGGPALATWWTALGDPVLDELERRALAANPGLAITRARLQQARAAYRLERANTLPNGNVQALYLHGELPPVSLGGSSSGDGQTSDPARTSLDFFNLGVDASWEVDLFGGKRRAREAAEAEAGSAVARVEDAQVSLTAEVAQAYCNLRDRQQRIALSREATLSQRRLLALTEQRVAAGTAAELDIERIRQQLESTDAQTLPLEAERDGFLNALAVLLGEAPGAVDVRLAPIGAVPAPPATVAIGDPASLLARRPDIRAAERLLASKNAKIGVAEAARFPKINFTGVIGMGGGNVGDILDPDNLTALALPRLAWNLFDFGRNRARIRQAEGVRDEAEAQYRQTLLAALRDAEDSLARFGARRSTLASVLRASQSANRAAALMQQRYTAGTVGLTDVLDVERQRITSQQNVWQARAAMTVEFVTLQKALGLGWTPEA